MNSKMTYCILILTLFFLQCACKEHAVVLKSEAVPVVQNSSADKIIFINLNFWKTDTGSDSCKVINTIFADGKLKGDDYHEAYDKDNYYTIILNSCDGKLLYKQDIVNQLDNQMEVFNEGGIIELKKTSFKQREFSMRLQQGKEKFCRIIVTKNEKGQIKTMCNQLI